MENWKQNFFCMIHVNFYACSLISIHYMRNCLSIPYPTEGGQDFLIRLDMTVFPKVHQTEAKKHI